MRKTFYTKAERKEIYLQMAAQIAKTEVSIGLCVRLGDKLPGGFNNTSNQDIYQEFPEVFKYISPFYENPSKNYLPIPLFWFSNVPGHVKRNDIRVLILLFAAEMI